MSFVTPAPTKPLHLTALASSSLFLYHDFPSFPLCPPNAFAAHLYGFPYSPDSQFCCPLLPALALPQLGLKMAEAMLGRNVGWRAEACISWMAPLF